MLPAGRQVLVFSDDIPAARVYLRGVVGNAIFIEDVKSFEGLFLQSLCRDYICPPSTFSWWGAWLGAFPDKTVVVPKEGAFRPGAPFGNLEFWPEAWLRIPALRPLVDSRNALMLKDLVTRAGNKLFRTIRVRGRS
jgi:hypothetical protein